MEGREVEARGSGAAPRSGGGRLPDELRALGRALESPRPGVRPMDDETLVERVMARIVRASAATPATAPTPEAPDQAGRQGRPQVWPEEQWRELPGLTAGQGPVDIPGKGGVSRSADRGRGRPPSAPPPHP